MGSKKYDPLHYWHERLSKEFSLGSVGSLGLGEIYNSWLYKLRKIAVNRAIQQFNIEIQGRRILDVGCGTGFWIDFWENKGANQVWGIDIAPIVIERLRHRFPEYNLYQADISDVGFSLSTTFDIISAFDVLFHITDDDSWRIALRNIAHHLKPDGWLLITDLFLHQTEFRGYHQVSRKLSTYETELNALEFNLMHRIPVFVFAHPPLDAQERWRNLLEKIWNFQKTTIYRARRFHVEPIVAHMLGFSFFLFDSIATWVCREGPSMELLICRKN
jgi:SAM-dependent methyltransferase